MVGNYLFRQKFFFFQRKRNVHPNFKHIKYFDTSAIHNTSHFTHYKPSPYKYALLKSKKK